MFKLPDLTYDYNALEPFIDEMTMRIHHTKHHQGYVDKLNAALQEHDDLVNLNIEELLGDTDKLPESIRQSVINNGGGHANHSMFWQIIHPPHKASEDTVPAGEFKDAIEMKFGSIDVFKEKFTEKALGVFGSGWAFLEMTKEGINLKKHSFQNSPLMHGNIPIIGIDVWEHAYYLKYQNRRAEYVSAWWNVVNWEKVEERYMLAKKI
jgi:Fe-Mn family superoxide dismutase